MGIFSDVAARGAEKVLTPVIKGLVEKYLDGIVSFQSLKLENSRPTVFFTLEGIPDVISAKINLIDIVDDGHSVKLGQYTSNMPFIEKALNKFATRTIEVEDNKAALALCGVRKIFL